MKKMLKLIFKCFWVMLPLIALCFYMSEQYLYFLDDEASAYTLSKEMTNTTQEKYYGVIILGDSGANSAYVPEVLSDDTINLSLGGMTPVENYYVLKEWLEHHEAPRACYISFKDDHMHEAECFWVRAMYAHRLCINEELEILKAAAKYQEESIATEHYLLDYISYKLWFPDKYITSFLNASFNQRYDGNVATQQYIRFHRGRYIGMDTRVYDVEEENLYSEFWVDPMFDEYYKKMIELCMEYGVAVHLVKVPYPDNTFFSDEYLANVNSYYDKLQNDYPDITVDIFSEYGRDCFLDKDHMNIRGGRRFSAEIKEMYSDDFDTSYVSLEQVDGINEYLLKENRLEEILLWTYGKDYTVIFCDGGNVYGEYYENEIAEKIGMNALQPYQTGVGSGQDMVAIYYLSDTGREEQTFSVLQNDGGLAVMLENGEGEWIGEVSNQSLKMIVIDNYHNCIVLQRTFQYGDGTFVPQ